MISCKEIVLRKIKIIEKKIDDFSRIRIDDNNLKKLRMLEFELDVLKTAYYKIYNTK